MRTKDILTHTFIEKNEDLFTLHEVKTLVDSSYAEYYKQVFFEEELDFLLEEYEFEGVKQ